MATWEEFDQKIEKDKLELCREKLKEFKEKYPDLDFIRWDLESSMNIELGFIDGVCEVGGKKYPCRLSVFRERVKFYLECAEAPFSVEDGEGVHVYESFYFQLHTAIQHVVDPEAKRKASFGRKPPETPPPQNPKERFF